MPEEYLSFINSAQSTTCPSFDFDILTPNFADPAECRSFTFLPRDQNPVIPFKLKDHLISCFFTHFHRYCPMLLLPEFFELCYPVCQHPAYIMNAIYAIGSIYSRHPAIVNGECNYTPTRATNLGKSFARITAEELNQVMIKDLNEDELPNYMIASILLCIYENGMNLNLVKKTKYPTGTLSINISISIFCKFFF